LQEKRLEETDHQVHRAIQSEINWERNNLLMIASENYASESVIEAQANVMTKKYADSDNILTEVREAVLDLCSGFPIYQHMEEGD
jgi:glycine/serine hydroxymethyltransferase